MKQTLLLTISSIFMAILMTACTGQTVDNLADNLTENMASVGKSSLSSDPCVALDKKLFRLDRFTEVVKNTSAFHLEEKAAAIPTPGITVSNNRKQMLRDADKKYAEYSAERQKYGCETPMSAGTGQITNKMSVEDDPMLSSCAAIDQKFMRLDRFTEVVKNTSAFHLEEKAAAIPTPGITVSNNRKQMLRDADKKYIEYTAEREKHGCEIPMSVGTAPMADKMVAVDNPTLSSDLSVDIDKKIMKTDEFTTKVNNTSTVHAEDKAAVLLVPASTASSKKEQMQKIEEKKSAAIEVEHPKYTTETPTPVTTAKTVEKKAVVSEPVLSSNSSDSCDAIDKELIKLYEFMIMVNNTSAFHLEEKAAALSVPGITVSNNKKKMLRDGEKKRAELSAEREKYGCDTAGD